MIYGFSTTIMSDIQLLKSYVKDTSLMKDNDQALKIKIAALRMLSVIGMTFAALWTIKIAAGIITYPLRLLAPILTMIVMRDVFVMCQNASKHQLEQEQGVGGLWALFAAIGGYKEDLALKFTNNTFFQPTWMWLYNNTTLKG